MIHVAKILCKLVVLYIPNSHHEHYFFIFFLFCILLVLWECCTMYLIYVYIIYIHPFSQSSKIYPLQSPCKCWSSPLSKTIKCNSCCQNALGYEAIPWSMVNPPLATPPNNTDSPLFQSFQLPIVPQVWRHFMPTFPFHGFWVVFSNTVLTWCPHHSFLDPILLISLTKKKRYQFVLVTWVWSVHQIHFPFNSFYLLIVLVICVHPFYIKILNFSFFRFSQSLLPGSVLFLKINFKKRFTHYLFVLCVYVCIIGQVWKSENSCGESIPSFHREGLRHQTQRVRLDTKHFTHGAPISFFSVFDIEKLLFILFIT